MYITTVIPIARGISKDTLTYFTKEEIPRGSLVSIPLRKKFVSGIVVETKAVNDVKSEIKSLTYSIKKIKSSDTKKFLPDSYMRSVEYLADYYATSIGAILYALIPNSILESKELPELPILEKEIPDTSHEVLLVQADNDERYALYRSLIREEFAKNKSVFFCLPSIEDIKNAKEILEKGIEKFTFVIHSGLTKKEVEKTWKDIISETHPVLVIATGSFLLLPKTDIGSIIIDKENSRSYKTQTRPFLDIRTVAETIAKKSGIKLILGDILLRTETLWKEREGLYVPLSPLKFRALTTANCEKVSMKIPKDMEKKEFVIISNRLKEVLSLARETNDRTFLFCGRKGMHPETVCSDCGEIVTCENCNAPVVLYGRKNAEKETTPSSRAKLATRPENLFVCHHCGERREADVLCKKCNGWRLTTLGIGTEKVYEEIKKLFPETLVQILDKENTKTHKDAVKTRDKFYASPGSILIGTEMALSYLNQEIENTAVVAIDSFFSIPDFRINEKIFHILLEMRAMSQKNMILQTRQDTLPLFDYALRGNLIDFYRDEIQERKEINYPPFVTNIKLTIEGTRVAIKKQMEKITEDLKPFEMSVFEAFSPKKTAGIYTLHGLITLPKNDWVDDELLTKLRNLPPFVMVKIDPDTLL